MSNTEAAASAAEKAPKAWKGWRSIQGAVNVSLRQSLYNAGKINRGVGYTGGK